MKNSLASLTLVASGVRRYLALLLCAALLASIATPVFAQKARGVRITTPTRTSKSKSKQQDRRGSKPKVADKEAANELEPGQNEGGPLEMIYSDVEGVPVTMLALKAAQRRTKPGKPDYRRFRKEHEAQKQKGVPPGTQANALAAWPPSEAVVPDFMQKEMTPLAPQTTSTQFDGATGPTDTGAFPPDTMGAVGPTQFFVFLNGRLRTFNKTTGTADGVINVDPDVFFASVLTTPGMNEVVFTSDPNVRYDRTSGRWFITIIDVPLNLVTGIARANRVLIAVSDAASSNALSGATVWTLYQFQGDGAGTRFTDYPSLGIDASALYIGGNMFSGTTGGFSNTRALIIPKAPFLTGAAITVFAANNLITTSGAFPGPFAPRGVDNPDPANTGMTATGYFIGADFGSYNTLTLRRLTNPGAVGGSPTISGNILVTTPLTTNYDFSGQAVPHLGNTLLTDTDGDGNADGNLDALDDRLYAAVIRSGRLWTAHNIGVNSAGVATPNAAKNTAANDRMASRWYELQNLGTTPAVLQSGTVFDNAAVTPRNYWIPSIAVSGQGHAAFGSSIAGSLERVNAFTTGRLSGDTLGALRDGSPGTPAGYTASSTAYNPPGDPGPTRRWGDYSFTSLDPKDDMTLWTIQEYCNGTNTYGVRAVKLLAPLPATPSSASNSVRTNKTSATVTITGTQVSGSAFYDPGADPPAPHTAYTHISATVSGGVTVNSVTYNSPTSITLSLNTVGAAPGLKDVTVTNPDGQSMTGNNVINVLPGITGGQLLISEFRLHGSNVTTPANDEYVELYNNTNSPLDISATSLWAITGGLPSVKFVVPNNTTLPARGHYLITGSTYSLGGAATGDGSLSSPIADDSGLGLFDNPTSATAADRLDSVGFANVTDPNYFEGSKLLPTAGVTADGEYCFFRKMTTASGGLPQDTGSNLSDFDFVSTNGGTFSGLVSVLGAPGPENFSGPLVRNTLGFNLLDPLQGSSSSPNRSRNLTPVTNGANGTLIIRRSVTNNTASPITRLRFRIVDFTTFNSPNFYGGAQQADLRALDSGSSMVTVNGSPVTVEGTSVETPPAQPNGGAMNSTYGRSLVSGTIINTSIAPGQTVNIQFVLGVQVPGQFKFFFNIEALP